MILTQYSRCEGACQMGPSPSSALRSRSSSTEVAMEIILSRLLPAGARVEAFAAEVRGYYSQRGDWGEGGAECWPEQAFYILSVTIQPELKGCGKNGC